MRSKAYPWRFSEGPLGKKAVGITHSVCEVCGALVPARIESDGEKVFFRKTCPDHGESRALIWNGLESYLAAGRYIKPGWTPRTLAGDAGAPCPQGCGSCERHEQHLCLPIVEITDRCDLSCPCCLLPEEGGRSGDLDLPHFARILDSLIAGEGKIDILNLSGGEPLIHPRLLELADEALCRPQIARVSVSTNGLRLLGDSALLSELKRRDVVVCLQFDGFDDRAYTILRGRPMLQEKLRILDLLGAAGISTSLTFTAAAGVNEDQYRSVLDLLFGRDHIVSLMVQPLAFSGRGEGLRERLKRFTLPDAIRALDGAGHPAVAASDFVPLPCSHPACFSLGFFVVPAEGGPLSVTRLVDAETLLDCLANQVFFGLSAGEQERLKSLVYDLWSGPAGMAPDTRTVMDTVRQVLRQASEGGFSPRKAFLAAERRIKSIFVHAFQDSGTFDLSRVRRCCNGYPQADGRILPACVRNVMGGG